MLPSAINLLQYLNIVNIVNLNIVNIIHLTIVNIITYY